MEAEITEDTFIEYMSGDFPSFKVTKCNLSYPTSDFVTSYYSLMFEALTAINNSDQLWNLTEEQWSHVKANPKEGNAFLQHICFRNLHAVVKYIFNQVNPNVQQFTYSDILSPENTPRRSFVFMSFMLNCFYYFVTFSEELNADMAACEAKGREIRSRKELKEKLQNQLKELKEKRVEDAEMLRSIKARALKYSASNKDKEDILMELNTKRTALLEELRKLEEKEMAYQNEQIKLQNNVDYFKSLIVQNPNEVAEIYSSNEKKKLECKDKMKHLEAKVKSSSVQLARFNKVIELLNTINNIIMRQDCSDSFIKKDFTELQSCISNLNEKLSNLQASELKISMMFTQKELLVPKLKAELAHHKSEQAAIICKGEERCKTYKNYIENQEKSYTQMNINLKKNEREMEIITGLINKLSEKNEEVKQKIKAVDIETKEKYHYCVNEIKNAFNLIRETLNM